LVQALERRVPEVLARGGRRISVGRLSYSVKRGPFALGLERNALIVEVPIHVAASVCVPFGALCPSVGGCSPKLKTIVEVPLALNDRYELGPSRVSTVVERGCTIAGHDATGQVKQNARRQSAQLQRQIDQLLPSVRPEAETIWRGLQQPLPLDQGACLTTTPQQVVQLPAVLDAEHLSFRLAFVTPFEQLSPCPPREDDRARGPLPPPSSRPTDERWGRLAVVRQLPWLAAAEQLQSVVKRGEPPLREDDRVVGLGMSGVRAAHASSGDDGARIALSLAVEGTGCGPLWLLAEPRPDPNGPFIGLDRVVPYGSTDQAATVELSRWMQEHAKLDAGPSASGISAAIQSLVERAVARRGASVEVGPYELVADDRTATAALEGLVVTERSRGEIVLTVR
jgi:hypothetical protein